MFPDPRRHPRASHFALGVSVTAISSQLLINWFDIANARPFGQWVIYDSRPAWLRALMTAVEYLPWAVLAALVVLRVRRGPAVRPLAYAAGAVSYYAALVAWLFLGPAVEERWHRTRFDPVAWRAKDRGSDVMWPPRLTMVDDLLSRHDLHGLTRDSVERLLGPRDDTSYWRDWDLVYRLGPERGLIRIDSEWLVLRLDAAGRVTDYRIVRD